MYGKANHWLPNFIAAAPAYSIFSWLPKTFLHQKMWPDLMQYNQLVQERKAYITKDIQFVPQNKHCTVFSDQYEPRIYLKGQIQTRRNNWHDFFNTLIWLTFPNLKSLLNSLQYQELKKREHTPHSRSSKENLLTLFDENGIIILSQDVSLLEMIKKMEWKNLFWHHRDALKNLSCIVFGHSLHEKILQPYIGMTGHALLFHVSDFSYNTLDTKVCEYFKTIEPDVSPRVLYPVPILGFPGWHSMTSTENFYDDESYFRTSRRYTHYT